MKTPNCHHLLATLTLLALACPTHSQQMPQDIWRFDGLERSGHNSSMGISENTGPEADAHQAELPAQPPTWTYSSLRSEAPASFSALACRNHHVSRTTPFPLLSNP